MPSTFASADYKELREPGLLAAGNRREGILSIEIVAEYEDSNGRSKPGHVYRSFERDGLAGLHFVAREEDGGFRLVEGTGEIRGSRTFRLRGLRRHDPGE
jgi:hypothetical protein